MLDRLIGHLELSREPPSLDYLHRLVRQHQLRVPFETLTKLIDWEPGRARGDFLPPLDVYVERIVTRRAGGLCWTLARGFHALLLDLGFDASLMIMEPGHCCVRVELPEGPQYADVGYAAPLFRAYPLFESFTVTSPTLVASFRPTFRPEFGSAAGAAGDSTGAAGVVSATGAMLLTGWVVDRGRLGRADELPPR